MSRPQGHSAAERFRAIKKIHLIGTRTREFPACSIVPQPLRYHVALTYLLTYGIILYL
jgi:hypothetical protein